MKRFPKLELCIDTMFVKLHGLHCWESAFQGNPVKTGNNHRKYAASVVKHGGILGHKEKANKQLLAESFTYAKLDPFASIRIKPTKGCTGAAFHLSVH